MNSVQPGSEIAQKNNIQNITSCDPAVNYLAVQSTSFHIILVNLDHSGERVHSKL